MKKWVQQNRGLILAMSSAPLLSVQMASPLPIPCAFCVLLFSSGLFFNRFLPFTLSFSFPML